MSVAVQLASLVMAVIAAEGSEFFQPLVDIGDESVLGVIHPDPRCNVHGRNQNHAFSNTAFFERALYLRRDVDVFTVRGRVEGEVLGQEMHIARILHAR